MNVRHWISGAALLTTLVVGIGQAGLASAKAPAKDAKDKGKVASVERGKYIVSTAGCHDCHTPWAMGPEGPAPDMSRALSGHPREMVLPPPPEPVGPWIVSTAATNTAFAGPWGISYSANLTPHKDAGTGAWDTQTFIDTIRNGRHMGRGRELLPPMPWPVYSNMTDQDLASVFAYLQTLPAIDNKVPEPVPPASAMAME